MWILTNNMEQLAYIKIAKRLSSQLHIPEDAILHALKDESYEIPPNHFNFYTKEKININDWSFKPIRIDGIRYSIHPSSGLIFKRSDNVYYFVGYKTSKDDLIEHTECPKYVLDWINYQEIPCLPPNLCLKID